jgi:hypothetical protein
VAAALDSAEEPGEVLGDVRGNLLTLESVSFEFPVASSKDIRADVELRDLLNCELATDN